MTKNVIYKIRIIIILLQRVSEKKIEKYLGQCLIQNKHIIIIKKYNITQLKAIRMRI